MKSRYKGAAKSAVMEPRYRMRVERDRKKHSKADRRNTKKALKQGLYSFIRPLLTNL